MLIEFCLKKELCVLNTWFKRRERGRWHSHWEEMRPKLTWFYKKRTPVVFA